MRSHVLIAHLEQLFMDCADPFVAQAQAAYMKDKFIFYGLKKPTRAKLQKESFKKFPVVTHEELVATIEGLWLKSEREFQYAALDLAQKNFRLWSPAIFLLFEQLVRAKSWWDTVDTIASSLIGKLVLQDPELRFHMDNWITDDNFWIRRSALIYQLKHKKQTNHEKLFFYCATTSHEKEFFIRKAIGWALREYSKTDPERVKDFIEQHKNRLSPLSIKEGGKYV
jgi:3-methyladenine DNA glycosylase AlkD